MVRPLELAGQTFGRLTVLGRAGNDGAMSAWLCVCTCGQEKRVRGGHLRSGATSSCGCLNRETLRKPDDQITYNSAHYRVKRAKGYPSTFPCVDGCGQQAAEWSLRQDAPVTHVGDDGHGRPTRYSGDPNDYEPRCRKCHKAYDMRPRT
jgi:hypothetical protein